MRIYHRLCKSLLSAGYRVSLLANTHETTVPKGGIELNSLGEWSSASNGSSLPARVGRCRKAYAMATREQADIYTFYSPEFAPWVLSLQKKTRRPIIFDCMENFEAYALLKPGIPKALRQPLSWLVGAVLRHVSAKIDAVVFSDPGTAKRFERSARRAIVIHNFPDLSLFPLPEMARLNKPFDLTYHGGFYIHDLRALLAIDDALVSRNRRLKWRFIGGMPGKEWFTSEIAKRGAGDRFHLLDRVAHDKVAGLVCQAKIGIIPLPNVPKYQTNIPQKLFEFMALEMPVILSNLPPSRPFVADERCAFMVRPDDANAYADAISHLIDDPNLRCEMGRAGRRRVETMYNWQRESTKLLALYEELLKCPVRKK